MVTNFLAEKELKDMAYRLASILSSDDTDEEEARSLIERLGYGNGPRLKKGTPGIPEATDHVGIYKRETVDGQTRYVRDISMKDRWSFYADIQTIGPKGAEKRIVFLGESAARGFLLDPDYTPALVMEALLKKCPDLQEAKVIDLAETNLSLDGLYKRFFECLALEPDAVVILAGNNWRSNMLDYMEDNQEYFDMIARAISDQGSILGAKTIMEDVFRTMITTLIREMGAVSKAGGIPVIYAIPEFNLLDCHSTLSERALTRLSNNEIREWVFCERTAEKAIAENDFQHAEASAQRMIELDPSHPLGFELMGESKFRQRLFGEARFYLEEARDTAIFCRTTSKPRIYKVIRETILREAAIHGVYTVDLPAVMREYLNGGIPGRDLFLDYCHYSMEGIQVVADAICERLIYILTGRQMPATIKANSIRAKQTRVGLSHLFAAIHNSHWGQSGEILQYHCLKAAKSTKEVQKIMVYYIDMACRDAPNAMCRSFSQLMSLEHMDKYIYSLVHPRNGKSMEVELIEAMSGALRQVGLDVSKYVKDLRIAEHSVNGRDINLLNSIYHVTSNESYLGTQVAYFQARLEQSRFFLIVGDRRSVQLRLTLRIPSGRSRHGEVTFLINDMEFSRLNANGSWKEFLIEVPAHMLKEGLNSLLILWPLPKEDQDETPAKFAINQRTDGASAILDNAYFVFGEIHSLIAGVDR